MPIIYKRNCNYCGKYYEGRGKFYCSNSCFLEVSGFKKGHKVPQEWRDIASKVHKNKIISEKQRKQISDTSTGRKLSEGTRQKMRKPKSLKTRKNMSESQRGEKSYNWKGGISKLNAIIRHSLQYRIWRSNVYQIYNFICQKCKKRGGKLEVHHIKEFMRITKEYNIKTFEDALLCDELWDVGNGIVFCMKCHRLFHKIYERMNTNKLQVEEFIK